MSVQSQRGRKVTPNKRSPLTTFYVVIGAVILLVVGFVAVAAMRGAFGGGQVTAITAPVGRTAEGFYYKGSPDASVKVIAYEDFQCPSCAFYNKQIAPLISRDYIDTGKVQFIYHEFPLSIHNHSVVAAEAARCAGDQGEAKFWQMHDMLFINQDQWAGLDAPEATYSSYAGQLGLNRSAFESCLSGGANQAAVKAAEQASIAAGVSATPTFSVNGKLVSAGDLASAIDAALRGGN
jgi:protein-disulfide isomerase